MEMPTKVFMKVVVLGVHLPSFHIEPLEGFKLFRKVCFKMGKGTKTSHGPLIGPVLRPFPPWRSAREQPPLALIG